MSISLAVMMISCVCAMNNGVMVCLTAKMEVMRMGVNQVKERSNRSMTDNSSLSVRDTKMQFYANFEMNFYLLTSGDFHDLFLLCVLRELAMTKRI